MRTVFSFLWLFLILAFFTSQDLAAAEVEAPNAQAAQNVSTAPPQPVASPSVVVTPAPSAPQLPPPPLVGQPPGPIPTTQEISEEETEAPSQATSDNPSQVLEDDQVMFNDLFEKINVEAKRPWQKPNYENQNNSLGYAQGAFNVPAGLEQRVSFWIDVFTKLHSDQGYLHDTVYPYIVYEVIDFSDIMKDPSISPRQKEYRREQRVKEAKKRAKQRLEYLAKAKNPQEVTGEELRYWYMFNSISEPNKFVEAQKRSRMRFQLGIRDRFLKGIYFSGRYIQDMEKTFRGDGLPIELTRLPFVESSFNTKARSRVGASGIWQFMRTAGREYMKLNASVDERNDPLRATQGAARKLKRNYEMLGSWPLAITGYNHGPSGVRRLVKKYGTSNIVELVEKRRGRFGFASANFYASFLAALIVEREATKYFGEVFWQPSLEGKEITLTKTVDHDILLNWFRGDIELAKEFNMHINHAVWRGNVRLGKGNFVRVPVFATELALTDLQKVEEKPLFKSNVYEIAAGDTLDSIAKSYRIRLRDLLAANEGLNPRRLRPGQKIYVPH